MNTRPETRKIRRGCARKFVAERLALAEFKPKLAEVRARPAPPEKTEPPFRLGTTPVLTQRKEPMQ